MKKETIVLLSFVFLLLVDAKANYVQETFLPDQKIVEKYIFDFETGQFSGVERKQQRGEEFFLRVQEAGDLFYRSSQKEGGSITIASGIYTLPEDSFFEAMKAYPLQERAEKHYQERIEYLQDNYVILQTRNKQKIALHILGIFKMRLHICWIMADPKTGLFAEEAKRELINRVKMPRQLGQPTSGQITLYSLNSSSANGFYFDRQELIPFPDSKQFYDQAVWKTKSQQELTEMQKRFFDYRYNVDVMYNYLENPMFEVSSGVAYVLKDGDLTKLPKIVQSYLQRSSIQPPEFVEKGVYLIRTIDAKYALVKIQSFDANSLTFSWLYQPDGSLNFPQKEIDSGNWNPPKPEPIDVTKTSLFDIYENQNLTLEEKKRLIKLAVEKGADIDAIRDEKSLVTLLCSLSDDNINTEFVKLLLSLDANPNLQEVNGWTSLHSAAKFGQYEICRLLIEKGAKTGIVNNKGETPLQMAIKYNKNGHNDKVIEYLKSKTIPDTLPLAAILCDPNAAERLLEEGHDPNEYDEGGYTPLHRAAESGCAEVCQVLLRAGANPELERKKDNGKKTVLSLAAYCNKPEVIKVLVEGYKFSPHNLSKALYDAVVRKDVESCKILLDKGAQSNYLIYGIGYETPYYAALRYGTYEVVKVFVDHGEKLPLWAAVRLGLKEEVERLIKEGEDINQTSGEGGTPLYYAVIVENNSVLDVLLKSKPNLDQIIKINDGYAALHYAIELKNIDAARRLIEAGADVNIQSKSQRTPLYLAVMFQCVEGVKLLLENNADPTIVPQYKTARETVKSQSLLEMAQEDDNIELCNLLKKYLKK